MKDIYFFFHWHDICKDEVLYRLESPERVYSVQKPVPIPSFQALQIAWQDPETVFFIHKNFALPEEHPEVICRRWISQDEEGNKWWVEIIEKNPFFSKRGVDLINAALIVIDAKSSKIIKRIFLSHVLSDEYIKIISGILSERESS